MLLEGRGSRKNIKNCSGRDWSWCKWCRQEGNIMEEGRLERCSEGKTSRDKQAVAEGTGSGRERKGV